MSKLKVLHFFNQYLPQTENWAFQLISHLPDTEIYVGAKHYLKNNFYHPEFTFYEHPYGAIDTYIGKLGKDQPLQLIRKILLKLQKPLLGNLVSELVSFARRNEIQLVHAHFADMGWYYREIPRKLNLPFIISFYGWDYERLPSTYPVYYKRYQQLFKEATLFLCEGEHGRRILQKMGCPSEKIKVQKLGVQVPSASPLPKTKKKDELRLVQVATFNEKKGHIYTIQAFKKALEGCPNMQLTLVGGKGDPGVKEKIIQYIAQNDLGSKVSVLEQMDYSKIHDFLKDYHVFIHPSCYSANKDCEGGAPIVLLDAQVMGLPVISTKHCDIPGEVVHQVTGLLGPEKDIEELAELISRFYFMENNDYQQFSINARLHVKENYDINKNAVNLTKIYKKLL